MTKLNPSSLYLNPDDLASLQKLAAFCGFIQSRGAGANLKLPNLSALNRALARLPESQWEELKNLLQEPTNEPH